MATLIIDPDLEEQLLEQRRASGGDRYDEVWDGVYIMSPMADDEHQQLVSRLIGILQIVIDWAELGDVRPGVNITDREDDWKKNYRVPDVAVFLRNTSAQNRGTHWLGGPDFAVEIASTRDQTRDKLPFYASVGTRELLLIDRDPWALELYRLQEGRLVLTGTATIDTPTPLLSNVVPLSFRLVPGGERPGIEVMQRDGTQQRWNI